MRTNEMFWGKPNTLTKLEFRYCYKQLLRAGGALGEDVLNEHVDSDSLSKHADSLLTTASPLQLAWLEDALCHPRKKWFVAELLSYADKIPLELFNPIIRAAVYETDPQLGRWFIEPAVRYFFVQSVQDALLAIIATGTDFEKAGAIHALSWAERPWGRFITDLVAHFKFVYAHENKVRQIILNEFVTNENVEVRRAVIYEDGVGVRNGMIDAMIDAELYPIVLKLIDIGRDHPDDYIRQTIQMQLGLIPPAILTYPERKQPN